jgi:hypothetical protein
VLDKFTADLSETLVGLTLESARLLYWRRSRLESNINFKVKLFLQLKVAFEANKKEKPLLVLVIPTAKHFIRRQDWHDLRRCLSIVHVFVAGHTYAGVSPSNKKKRLLIVETR